MDKTKVRYVVKYNDRTYEHPLHSNKKFYIKNVADVVNIIEYCVVQDLKKELYEPTPNLYNIEVKRLVNDKEDTTVDGIHNSMVFGNLMHQLVDRMVIDNKTRHCAHKRA